MSSFDNVYQEAASRSFGGSLGGLLSKSNQSPSSHKEPAAELFFLEIERNPPQSSKDIKVKMKTEALDIIYNEGVVTKVKQFFSPRRRAEATMSKELSEFHLAGNCIKTQYFFYLGIYLMYCIIYLYHLIPL